MTSLGLVIDAAPTFTTRRILNTKGTQTRPSLTSLMESKFTGSPTVKHESPEGLFRGACGITNGPNDFVSVIDTILCRKSLIEYAWSDRCFELGCEWPRYLRFADQADRSFGRNTAVVITALK
jgi:hypothetical protein